MEIRKAPFLLLLILIGAAFASNYTLTSQVFDSGAVLNGSGGNYTVASEMGLISGNSSSTNYGGLYGLFLYLSNNTQQFNGTILLQITYPPNNSAYGPGQCWLSTTVVNYINGSAAQPTGTCWLYFNNGTNWVLNQTASIIGNQTINWTGFNVDGLYGVNCTSTSGSATNTTGLTQFNILGTGLCPSNPNVAGPSAIWIIIVMVAAVLLCGAANLMSWEGVAYIILLLSVGGSAYLGLTAYGPEQAIVSSISDMYFVFSCFLLLGATTYYILINFGEILKMLARGGKA